MSHRSLLDIIYTLYSVFLVSCIRQKGLCGSNAYYKCLSAIVSALPFNDTHYQINCNNSFLRIRGTKKMFHRVYENNFTFHFDTFPSIHLPDAYRNTTVNDKVFISFSGSVLTHMQWEFGVECCVSDLKCVSRIGDTRRLRPHWSSSVQCCCLWCSGH